MPYSHSISIIIVNYNSWSVLDGLLRSIAQQKLPKPLSLPISVIVVDNNSTLLAPDFATVTAALKVNNIEISWINNPQNSGFATGCNIGAATTDASLLLFCNPDIVIPAYGLATLLKIHQNNPINIVSPAQQNKLGIPQRSCGRFPSLKRYIPLIGGFFKSPQITQHENEYYVTDWVSGAVMLMSNTDFKQLNGWDENFFMFMEDVDLCYRASQLGLTVAVTDITCWLHHHGSSSQHQIVDKVRSKSAALAAKHIFVRKHFKGLKKHLAQGFIMLKYLPELMLGWIISWLIPKPIFISRRLILLQYIKDYKKGFKKSI